MKTNIINNENYKIKLVNIIKEEIVGEQLCNDNISINDQQMYDLSFDIVEKILYKFKLTKNN